MLPAKAAVFLRQSPEWQNLDYKYLDSLAPFERRAGIPIGYIRQLVSLWDEAFRLSYFEIRQLLKNITLRNLASVKNAVIYSTTDAQRLISSPRFYLFTDDDDWFNPEIISRLEAYDTDALEGIIWQSVKLARKVEVRRNRHCFTNNYCVTSDFVSTDKFWVEIQSVLQHFDANKVILRDDFNAFFLEEPLSVANKHPCSPARLLNEYGADLTVDLLRRDTEDFLQTLQRHNPFEELPWAGPCMSELSDIFVRALP